MHVKSLLCDVERNRGNLVHRRLPQMVIATPPSWHTDAPRRPPHHPSLTFSAKLGERRLGANSARPTAAGYFPEADARSGGSAMSVYDPLQTFGSRRHNPEQRLSHSAHAARIQRWRESSAMYYQRAITISPLSSATPLPLPVSPVPTNITS
jgi:hypothetical protein